MSVQTPPAPQAPKRPWYRRARVLAPASLVVGLLIGSAGAGGAKTTSASPTEGSTETVTVTATAGGKAARKVHPAPATSTTTTATFDGDGTYLIPADIKPGTYRSGKPDINCYWARLSDPSGGLRAIIANNNSAGPSVVTVKATDKALQVTGCAPFTRVG